MHNWFFHVFFSAILHSILLLCNETYKEDTNQKVSYTVTLLTSAPKDLGIFLHFLEKDLGIFLHFLKKDLGISVFLCIFAPEFQ